MNKMASVPFRSHHFEKVDSDRGGRLFRAYFGCAPLGNAVGMSEWDMALRSWFNVFITRGTEKFFYRFVDELEPDLSVALNALIAPDSQTYPTFAQDPILPVRALTFFKSMDKTPEDILRFVRRNGWEQVIFTFLMHVHGETHKTSMPVRTLQVLPPSLHTPKPKRGFGDETARLQKRVAAFLEGAAASRAFYFSQVLHKQDVPGTWAPCINFLNFERNLPFEHDDISYRILAGPYLLKHTNWSELGFAILPQDHSTQSFFQRVANPNFEHFDGAVVFGGFRLEGDVLVVTNWQTDLGHLCASKGISCPVVDVPDLALAGIRTLARQYGSNEIILKPPLEMFYTYWDGTFHPHKASIYAGEAEGKGLRLVSDESALFNIRKRGDNLCGPVYWYHLNVG